MQKGCILTGQGFSIWRESRVALATAIAQEDYPLEIQSCQSLVVIEAAVQPMRRQPFGKTPDCINLF